MPVGVHGNGGHITRRSAGAGQAYTSSYVPSSVPRLTQLSRINRPARRAVGDARRGDAIARVGGAGRGRCSCGQRWEGERLGNTRFADEDAELVPCGSSICAYVDAYISNTPREAYPIPRGERLPSGPSRPDALLAFAPTVRPSCSAHRPPKLALSVRTASSRPSRAPAHRRSTLSTP